MMKKLLMLTLVICVTCVVGYGQQTRAEIQQKQKQLQQELADLNTSLSDVRKSKKLSLRELGLIEQKIKARKSLIGSINNEMTHLDESIALSNREIELRRRQLDTLKQKYAESIVFAYKHRSNYNYISFLFSASSFNDAIRRMAYLKSYHQFRQSQVSSIKLAQTKLEENIRELQSSKTLKNVALGKQNTQLTGLQSDRLEKDSTINLLKGQEGDIGKEIAANAVKRRKLQQVLQAVIRREIAEAEREERARQARADAARKAQEERDRIAAQQRALEQKQQEAAVAAANQKAAPPSKAEENTTTSSSVAANTPPPPVVKKRPETTPAVAPSKTDVAASEKKPDARANRSYNVLESTDESLTESIDFEKGKGSLPWPVTGGLVSEDYGVQSIPGTSLRQVNDGIEIMTTNPGNTAVRSVASGTVSVVFEDGGYSVIVRHGKYFTTYSNLASVSVGRGDKVNAGTVLGRMATDNTGAASMFFMVTDSRGNSLNPRAWLKGH